MPKAGPLYSMSTGGSEAPVTLFAEPAVSNFELSLDGEEVIFETRDGAGARYRKIPIGGGPLVPVYESAGAQTDLQWVRLLSNGDLLLIDDNGADPRHDLLILIEGVSPPAARTLYLPAIQRK